MYRVLIADDEAYILQGLEKKYPWNTSGFDIVSRASNGLECLEAVADFEPDIIITDIRMPGFDGLTFIRRVLAERPDALVVFISGYSDFSYAREALNLGALGYLLKPVGREDLESILTKAKDVLDERKKNALILDEVASHTLMDFLRELPAELDEEVIRKRLGFDPVHKDYICITRGSSAGDSLFSDFLSELPRLRILHTRHVRTDLINSPAGDTAKTMAVLEASKDNPGGMGLSEVFGSLCELYRRIGESREAFLQSFVHGRREVLRYSEKRDPLVREILDTVDPEALTLLLEQICLMGSENRIRMKDLVLIHNHLVSQANRKRLTAESEAPLFPLYSDAEQLVHGFADLRDLELFLRDLVDETDQQMSRKTERFADVVRLFVRKNLKQELSPQMFEDHFDMPWTNFSRRFKSETGTSLISHIRRERFSHACFLLENTKLQIQEITNLCGYSDYFYFAKIFKKEKGLSATEYRASLSSNAYSTLSG